jgi:hypothetical protein
MPPPRTRCTAHRGAAVFARQVHHFVDADAANRGGAFRGPCRGPLLELRKADRVARDVVVVEQVFTDQHVHHAQRQRGIGARHQGDVLVAFFGGQGAVGIDRDQLGAAPLGFLHAHPEVQVRGDRVAAPDDDQFGVLELFHVGADRTADGVFVAREAGGRAHGAVQEGRAQLVEEAHCHRFALQQAHGAAIAVRQDGLRIARGDRLQTRGDLVQCLVPGDLFELALALLADAAQRGQDAVRVVGAVDVARHLGAQHAGGGRMIRVALDLRRDAIFHGHVDGAGIGAIMGAGGPDKGLGHRINPGKNVENPILYTIPAVSVSVLVIGIRVGLK